MELTKDQLKDMIATVAGEVVTGKLAEAQKGQTPEIVTKLMGSPHSKPSDNDDGKGRYFGRIVMALAAEKVMKVSPHKYMEERWGKEFAEFGMQSSVGSTGGFMVPTAISSDFIPLLRAESVMMRFVGPNIVPMTNGNLTIAKQTGGATAQYRGENVATNASKPTLGQLKLTFKQLIAKVAISNSLIRYGAPSVDQFVTSDALAVVALKADQQFILGTGLQDCPKGLLYWAPSANKFNANASVTVDNVTNDLQTLLGKLEDNNVPMRRPVLLMSPRSKRWLMGARITNGPYAFRDEMLTGRLWGMPFATTTQIPNTYSSTKSKIFLFDAAEAIVAEGMSIEVAVTNEGAYTDDTGTLVSAYDRDETVVRVLVEHDFGMRYDEAVAVMEDVTWGA